MTVPEGPLLVEPAHGGRIDQGKGILERAIALDSGYALAHSGLADCYSLFMDYSGPRNRGTTESEGARAQAVELDDGLARPTLRLGAISEHEYDWNTAERELKRAIELRPGSRRRTNGTRRFSSTQGRLPEARAEGRALRASSIRPRPSSVTSSPSRFFNSRDYDRTVEQEMKTLELDPTFFPARAFSSSVTSTPGDSKRRWRPWTRRPPAQATSSARASGGGEGRSNGSAAIGHAGGSAPRCRSLPSRPVGGGTSRRRRQGGAFAWLEKAAEEQDPILALTVKSNPTWIRSAPIRGSRRCSGG